MAYAIETKVPVEQTQAEIRKMITKANADSFGIMESTGIVHIAFRLENRNVRFTIPMPKPGGTETKREESARMKQTRSRWRAVMLVIKAKLESVESGIETFDDAFLAHIQTEDGHTFGEHVKSGLRAIYSDGKKIPLLPSPSAK